MRFEIPYKDKEMEKEIKLTKSRIDALEKYYKNPVKCKNCGSIIKVPSNVKITEVRRKKFCNSSCSATYNNQKRYDAHIKEGKRFDENNKLYQRKWYQKNKELQIKRNNETQAKKKEFVLNVRKKSKCVYCNENHIATLDFHHVDAEKKDRTISAMIQDNVSIKRLEEEIAKCIILCANCHRKLHYEERLKKDLQII